MQKVIVTGSSGRIGSEIVLALKPTYDVVGIDRLAASTTTHIADISDADTLQRLCQGAVAVVHSAALHAPHVGVFSEDEFHRINLKGTVALARMARAEGVQRFIFTSTTALYGQANTLADKAAWITEQVEPQPRTIYHRTKLEAENHLALLASGRFKVRALRMSRCFPEDPVLMAAYRLHRGIDKRDVATAHVAALTDDGNDFGRVIISGQTPFLPEDAEELKTDAPAVIARRSPAIVKLFQSQGWTLPRSIDRVYDPSYAKQELNWESKHDSFDFTAMHNAL
ncbi:UDP-glucose 4-epimerase [Pseudovibrio sp. W64]|uniref:NAD-dependent epimerase/dehydratase family protein n=1 Tax=Pseudovibrio sp. W64 TaxID=1735583 RepID=UPI0007AE487D|nr:NAD(P)-dependent oxidoreductase [Pseudovibrio sp. W64]KZK78379.1 UDP-glucose 4-epimerase [Pseudovibrio sp. W64]